MRKLLPVLLIVSTVSTAQAEEVFCDGWPGITFPLLTKLRMLNLRSGHVIFPELEPAFNAVLGGASKEVGLSQLKAALAKIHSKDEYEKMAEVGARYFTRNYEACVPDYDCLDCSKG